MHLISPESPDGRKQIKESLLCYEEQKEQNQTIYLKVEGNLPITLVTT